MAAIVPATPEERTCVVLTGKAEPVGRADGDHRGDLRRRALRVGQVVLADLLADRDDDALPADHRAEAERDRDGDLDPARDEACVALVDVLLVVLEDVRVWPS